MKKKLFLVFGALLITMALTLNLNFVESKNSLHFNGVSLTQTAQAENCIDIMGWQFCYRWCGTGCCYTNMLTTYCVGDPQQPQ